MEHTFTGTIALSATGQVELTVRDHDGLTMAVVTERELKTTSVLATKTPWATIMVGTRGYVLETTATTWDRILNEAGAHLVTALRLRNAQSRYRFDLECGHCEWSEFGPAGARAATCMSCRGRRPITQYLDTLTRTKHVIIDR
jgi:hypothetical protein